MTPPPIQSYDTRRAGNVLDWSFILENLAAFAHSEPGKDRCRRLDFLDEPGLVRLAQTETTEAKNILIRSVAADFSALSDIARLLQRTTMRGVLEAQELLRVAQVLSLSRRIANLLLQEKEQAPNLAQIGQSLFADITLEKEITRCIDKDGAVNDNATAELKSLRERYHSIHGQVHELLQKMVDSKRFEEALQDEFFTLRNGRYVLPVRIEKKGSVDGIVHDISGSGLSLFIEPKEVTHLNNLLRTCELEIDREIYRILSMLSFRLADIAPALEESVTWLTELDFIFAKARYSIKLGANAPEINTRGVIELRQVRHPVLVWQGEKVVANDIFLDENKQVLVITGPNTGGKTVALKSVGICALMARAGLHIPAQADSSMPFFRRIFALVGDEQSIQSSLSSFSAHLLSLRYILEHLVPDSLVLIDEIGEGTDPNQGVALSKAMIERLQTGRVRTVITTHFAELTTLAFLGGAVVNASMEFDKEQFQPTFRLVPDLPGQSSAFEIAERLGLDRQVVSRAREFATGMDSRFEDVLRGLDEQRQELMKRVEKARQHEQETRLTAEKQAELLAEVKRSKKKLIDDERKSVRKAFDDARESINRILKELAEAPTYKRIEKARKDAAKVQENLERAFPRVEPEIKIPPESRPIADWTRIQPGERLFVVSVGNEGILEKGPDDKGHVRVIVSGARMTLPGDSCRLLPETKGAPERPAAFRPAPDESSDRPERTCDLRGMTADEALDRVREFLDEALRFRFPHVYLVHGHGTGVLKREVRQYCKTSPYVKTWRPGERGEGGDGATVVELDLE